EEPRVECVRPGVDPIRDDLRRLLRDRDEILPLGRYHAVALRALALRDEDGRSRGGAEQVLDEAAVDHVAAIQDDERVLEMRAGFPDRVGRAELFRLRDVGDVSAEGLPIL